MNNRALRSITRTYSWFLPPALLFLLLISPRTFAETSALERFLPEAEVATPVPTLSMPSLPEFQPAEVSIEAHNKGVDLNNSGMQELQRGNVEQAVRLFSQATEADPREKGFWNNLGVALKRLGNRSAEALEVFHRLIALHPRDYHGYYSAGVLLLEQLHQPRQALPYLREACERKRDDPGLTIPLAIAWEKSGFPDQALEILKQNAHLIKNDPYPMYLLGNLLLARREYSPAIRALQSASENDSEGFAWEALVRARYYAGQMDGLDALSRQVLQRFPKIINRTSLERLAFTLNSQNFRFIETIKVEVGNCKTVTEFQLLLRSLPNVPNHQQVLLEKSEWLINNQPISARPSPPNSEGRVTFSLPDGKLQPVMYLRLTYRISITPWLASRGPFSPGPAPDLAFWQKAPGLSLDDPRLEELHQRLKKVPGNGLQNLYLAVGKGLKYKENFKDHPVEWALSHPEESDCTEFAGLLTALCLKRGLPARMVTGFLIKSDLLNKETNIGHAWCEVYFPGKGWIPVDPTLGPNMYWAYFGNLLSDQILFDRPEPQGKARVSINITSSGSDIPLDISSSFFCSVL